MQQMADGARRLMMRTLIGEGPTVRIMMHGARSVSPKASRTILVRELVLNARLLLVMLTFALNPAVSTASQQSSPPPSSTPSAGGSATAKSGDQGKPVPLKRTAEIDLIRG